MQILVGGLLVLGFGMALMLVGVVASPALLPGLYLIAIGSLVAAAGGLIAALPGRAAAERNEPERSAPGR